MPVDPVKSMALREAVTRRRSRLRLPTAEAAIAHILAQGSHLPWIGSGARLSSPCAESYAFSFATGTPLICAVAVAGTRYGISQCHMMPPGLREHQMYFFEWRVVIRFTRRDWPQRGRAWLRVSTCMQTLMRFVTPARTFMSLSAPHMRDGSYIGPDTAQRVSRHRCPALASRGLYTAAVGRTGALRLRVITDFSPCPASRCFITPSVSTNSPCYSIHSTTRTVGSALAHELFLVAPAPALAHTIIAHSRRRCPGPIDSPRAPQATQPIATRCSTGGLQAEMHLVCPCIPIAPASRRLG